MDFNELKSLKQWVLCFAKVGEKIPLVITKKWIAKVLEKYPHYFEPDNEDYIDNGDDLWLVYTSTITDDGSKYYTGDLVNTGATENFRDGWLTYDMADKIYRNAMMLFPINGEKHLCLGFVFTKDCPCTVIDFDRKDGTTQQEVAYQDSWISKFNSYTERSISGNGYHVIIKGKIDPVKYPNTKGTGASGIRSSKRHKSLGIVGFEIYSEDRFVVVTEDMVSTSNTIADRQEELDELCAILKKPTDHTASTVDVDTEFKIDNSDDFICEMNFYFCEIIRSPEWDMIIDLFNGKCNYTYDNDASKTVYDENNTLTFPSQSEADFKLMGLIARYCKNDSIVKGIFCQSELARRPKATRSDYLNRMLERIRENERNLDVIAEESPIAQSCITTTDADNTPVSADEIVERIEERKIKEKEAERKALINEFINRDYIDIDAESVLVNSKWQNEETDPDYTVETLFCDTLYATDVVHQLKRVGVVPSNAFVQFNSDKDISYKRLLDKGFICTKGFNISDINALLIPPTSSALIYELTKWSFESRIKPILEVSLTAVLAIISGIVGKMWQLPTGTGLNNYFILSARSGIGKEGLHTTKNDLYVELKKRFKDTDFRRHVVDDDFASGQALVKRCLQEAGSKTGVRSQGFEVSFERHASFVNFQKEFGKNLSEMGESSKNMSAQSLRSQYLRLYTGSAESDMLSAMTYSNAENNYTETFAPAFSIVGETTISGIADAITPEMAQDGFLSRFTTITYKGGAVAQNKTTYGIKPADYVITKLNELLVMERELAGHNNKLPRFLHISLDSKADEFNLMLENWCMDMLDQAGDREHFRQAWNRCQLKVLKLAGLCAVCQNYSDPVINIQHMAWATRVVFMDIANVYDMISNGETALTGNAENTMATTLLDCMKRFVVTNDSVLLCNATNIPVKTIKVMRSDFVVPLSYLSYMLENQKVFVRYKYGYTKAINMTIEKLSQEGAIEIMPKAIAFSNYKTRSICYKLLDKRGLDEIR